MRFSDEVIANCLDDEWRTPPAVHRLLDNRGHCDQIACALERLARAGKIENRHEATMAPKLRDKSGPPVLCIDYYRKLQRRSPRISMPRGGWARHLSQAMLFGLWFCSNFCLRVRHLSQASL
jgi:hypothetical protein